MTVDLIKRVKSRHYLVSTNGGRGHHPDSEAIARVVVHAESPELHFNYWSDCNRMWADPRLKDERSYEARYPKPEKPGYLRIPL